MSGGCGCGGGSGGSGGCGSSRNAESSGPEVVDIAPFEALPVEPAAAEDVPARLIASSEQEWPIISVNEVSITPEAMARELQYHPAESREEAVYLAARALVIRELLQQRIAELGLSLEIGAGENEEEAATRLLLEREVHVPQCDEETSLRYYENNRGRFHSAPLLAVRHILLECAPDDDEARALAHVQAEILLQRLENSPGSFAELAVKYSACPSKAQGGLWGRSARARPCPNWNVSCSPWRRGWPANRWKVATAGMWSVSISGSKACRCPMKWCRRRFARSCSKASGKKPWCSTCKP